MQFGESLKSYLKDDEIKALLQAIDEGEETHALILNTAKISDEEFVRRFPHVRKHPFMPHAYLYDKKEYEFGKYMLYENGAYSIEEPSAMMPIYFLHPEKGDVILDYCAAPGGKSIAASLMMEGEGCLVANDISYPRAKALSQNIERMGVGNVVVASNDFVFSHVHFAETFDKIIVDAPCSGSAMMRKSPEARADWKYSKVVSCSKKQLGILDLAYSMLKKGGTIAYSTCSFNEEENEGVILAFRKAHPDAELIDLPDDPTFYRSEKLPEAVHLFPNLFEGEGQFVCLLRKPGELVRTKREVVANERYKVFLERYGLVGRSNEMLRNKFYSLYQHFDTSHLNILRYGVKLFEVRDIYIPDHHLTHFLDSSYSVPITLEEAKAYVSGGTFETNLKDDYYIVSYDKMNLGYVKVTQGIAKNHYPKGLRRDWGPEIGG